MRVGSRYRALGQDQTGLPVSQKGFKDFSGEKGPWTAHASPLFEGGATEAQRGERLCLASHSRLGEDQKPSPKLPGVLGSLLS